MRVALPAAPNRLLAARAKVWNAVMKERTPLQTGSPPPPPALTRRLPLLISAVVAAAPRAASDMANLSAADESPFSARLMRETAAAAVESAAMAAFLKELKMIRLDIKLTCIL